MTSYTVHCTHCETAFPVDPAKVPDGGVRARCTNCEGIFFVAKPETATVAPEAAGAEPVSTPPATAVSTPPAAAVAADSAETEVSTPPGESTEGEAALESPETEFEIDVSDIPESGGVDVEVPRDDEQTQAADADAAEVRDAEDETAEAGESAMHGEAATADSEAATADGEEATKGAGEDFGHLDLDDTGFGSFDDELEAVDPAAASTTAAEPPDSGVDDDIAPVPTGFQFGKRDPHEKAQRLARVLVSDMITYNPDRHTQALARGTLEDDFEDEIDKSWQEYVDQVGREMASSTSYWTDALNQILAKGEKLF